jgi:hypothetical protein
MSSKDLFLYILNQILILFSNNKTGYICSCLSGRKTAGCCVNVATLILYLSYTKYRDF